MELLDVLNTDMDEFAGATLTRIVMDLYVWLDDLGGTTLWGMGIVPLERDTVVAGAFPDPLTDEANWIINQRGVLVSTLNAATAIQQSEMSSRHYHYDLRGQRKVGVRETFMLLVENVAGGVELNWWAFTKVLYKLS